MNKNLIIFEVEALLDTYAAQRNTQAIHRLRTMLRTLAKACLARQQATLNRDVGHVNKAMRFERKSDNLIRKARE